MDAGGVLHHTQVGFVSGDEAKYIAAIDHIVGKKSASADAVAPDATESRPRPHWPASERPQRMLFYSASSTDAPHRAVLPLVFAVAAKKKGHDAVVFLAGDATLLLKPGVLAGTVAAGQPDASKLVDEAVALGVPIFL